MATVIKQIPNFGGNKNILIMSEFAIYWPFWSFSCNIDENIFIPVIIEKGKPTSLANGFMRRFEQD